MTGRHFFAWLVVIIAVSFGLGCALQGMSILGRTSDKTSDTVIVIVDGHRLPTTTIHDGTYYWSQVLTFAAVVAAISIATLIATYLFTERPKVPPVRRVMS